MKKIVGITSEKIELILHCRKSVLFHGKASMKKSKEGNFDEPQGTFDRAEISELMDIFILSEIIKIVHIDIQDGLIVAPDNKRANDSIMKNKLFKLFYHLNFEWKWTWNLFSI